MLKENLLDKATRAITKQVLKAADEENGKGININVKLGN